MQTSYQRERLEVYFSVYEIIRKWGDLCLQVPFVHFCIGCGVRMLVLSELRKEMEGEEKG